MTDGAGGTDLSVFLLAIALSLPIGISMILGATAPIALFHQGGTMGQVLNNAFSGANSTPILAVPLFILGGVIMAKGGISRKLFNFFAFFAGRIPRGTALCRDPDLSVLWCHFRFRPGYHGSGGSHVRPLPDRTGL